MANFTDTAFLCAYFSIPENINVCEVLHNAGWKHCVVDQKTFEEYRQYYYSEFLDFSLESSTSCKVRRFSYNPNQRISVGDTPVEIKEIVIYIMPYGMALYSIRVELSSDSLNDFTLALYRMREQRMWHTDAVKQFYEVAIVPLMNASLLLGNDSGSVIENGNKLKVFQIVISSSRETYPDNIKQTIFEVGTLGPVGGGNNSPDCPSDVFISKVLNDNYLSYYNNWCGLALFDTFTIMGFDVKPWVKETWENDYMSMIYIHSLFCKFYLFRLNFIFRTHPEKREELEREYQEFERRYVFSKISYNFLPGEIDKAIDKAIEISDERIFLARYISEYNKAKANEASHRLDILLKFLAVMTVFSTIWDLANMINAMWPFSRHAVTIEWGFRISVSLIMLFLIVVVLSVLRKPRR